MQPGDGAVETPQMTVRRKKQIYCMARPTVRTRSRGCQAAFHWTREGSLYTLALRVVAIPMIDAPV